MIGESSSFENVRNDLIVLIGQWKELQLHSLPEKIQLSRTPVFYSSFGPVMNLNKD